MTQEKTDRSWLDSPSIAFLGGVSCVYVSTYMILPGLSSTNPVFTWVVAAGIGFLFSHWSAIAGVFSGYCLTLLHTYSNPGLMQSPEQHRMLIIMTAVLLGFTTFIAHIRPKIRKFGLWSGFGILTVMCGMITAYSGNLKLNVIYLAGAIIVSFLACQKARFLLAELGALFMGWLAGYGLFLIFVRVLNLDPNLYRSSIAFLRSYFLLPYAVFVLQMLIVAHVIAAVKSTRTSHKMN